MFYYLLSFSHKQVRRPNSLLNGSVPPFLWCSLLFSSFGTVGMWPVSTARSFGCVIRNTWKMSSHCQPPAVLSPTGRLVKLGCAQSWSDRFYDNGSVIALCRPPGCPLGASVRQLFPRGAAGAPNALTSRRGCFCLRLVTLLSTRAMLRELLCCASKCVFPAEITVHLWLQADTT